MDALVSVLMSVHNEPTEFLDVAVNSICAQTYKNIEFIIIDDASDAETWSHLEYLQTVHPEIRLYRNEDNLGLTATLKKGLDMAKGEFIARMDADDYSCPQRIAKQVKYLDEHPDIDILGTGVVSFGAKIMFMSPMYGATNAEVQCNLFFTSSLCHPSVMIRKSFLQRTGLNYDSQVKKTQDYDFWERASVHGRLAVLKDVLLYYRLHPKQISSTNNTEQLNTTDMIMRRRLSRIGIDPTDREFLLHHALKGQALPDISSRELRQWVDKLIAASACVPYIDIHKFSHHLNERFVYSKLKRHELLTIRELMVAMKILKDRLLMKYHLKTLASRIHKELGI